MNKTSIENDTCDTGPDAGMPSGATRTRQRYLSIHGALMLAVIVAMTPALIIIIASGVEQGAELAEDARLSAARQVEAFAEIQARITESTRQMLRTLAALPGFTGLNRDGMTEILRAVHGYNQEYLNFTVVDTRGIVIASSLLQTGMYLGDRSHFRGALDSGSFASGWYMINMIDSTPAIAFAHPLKDESGTLVGAVAAIIKLDWYNTLFENFALPDESILGILDADGVRLYFYPPKETNPVGGTIKSSVWNGILAGSDSGLFVDTGSDGIDRFYAFKKLRLEAGQDPYAYVVYAAPLEAAYRTSQAILKRNMMLMAAVALFTLASAGFLSRRLFGSRLNRIVAATVRLDNGDLGARVGPFDDSPDLGRIARAFDSMAENVERRAHESAEASAAIAANLAEKEILLKEIHHRVKNNLQLILSLFVLQSEESDDPAAFRETMENRIRAMAMVHEMLYESENFSVIDLGSYAERLVDLVAGAANAGIRVQTTADAIACDLEKAITFGLMLNELVTNAFKHAFKGRVNGALEVSLHQHDGRATIRVRDDGAGLPPGFHIGEQSGLGLRLAQLLATQLEGELSWNDGPGTEFTVTFPLRACRA
ncbi:MAG: ATP-binding protein [Spirochaetales bacterium]|nr:ATP-binding protein [Spirochaetales bacterium]